jgi:hypothetical protein
MLNNINTPIAKLFAVIQNTVLDNVACTTKQMELDFMVAGGKERIYLNQLASRLTGNIITRLSDNVVEEETIRVFPEGMKTAKGMPQSLNASLYMVAAYSVLMSGYTSENHIATAIENWIDEDSVLIVQTIDITAIAQAIVKQFIIDEIIVSELTEGQSEEGHTFLGNAATAEIIELRLSTMIDMWEHAKPKMKPMLFPLTWYKKGMRVVCELTNLYFNEEVTQHFIDSLNKMGHTGYIVNNTIRAKIKKNLKKGLYKKTVDGEPLEATMRSMLELSMNKAYYFPHTPDYRGRAYARGGLTTFQGVKDLRAAFDFANYTKVDEYGLFLHIANAHGYDKASITDRMTWVKNNHIKLMTTPSDSLYAERSRLAYVEYKTSGLTNIIARIDGTCSGVQITSGLFLDSQTAKAVNVGISSPDDEPEDCYGLVAETALKLAKKGTDRNIIKKYMRDLTKKVVMILAYGAGEDTLIRTVREFLKENNERTNNAKSIQKLIMSAIDAEFAAITKLNNYLQIDLKDIQDTRKNEGEDLLTSITYQLSDIKVKLKPMNSQALNLYGSSYTAKLTGDSFADHEALARGIAPNLVHSLDSELLRKAVNYIDSDISCIHDDIGVQTCDVRKALQAVRIAYVEVIQAKPLETLYSAMGISEEYEQEDNGLNLTDVLESTYLFS